MSTPKFPFFDITRQYGKIKSEVMSRFEKLLDTQALIGGAAVTDFEKAAAEWMGVKHAVTCASGTDALIIALRAAGVKEGDEVITPAFSFFASSGAITWIGAKPVWADIRPDTYCIDVEQIKKRLTPKTKAIMVVHLYGQCVDMDPILDLAKQKGLYVIEDCAQSIGAKYKGRSAGGLGHIAAVSFYPTKNLGGAGDGGLVTTNDDALGRTALLMRQHGMPKRYTYEIRGFNSRLDSLQCAYLHVKLPYLAKWNERRAWIADYYNKNLKDLETKGLVLPVTQQGNTHVWHQYVVRIPNREEVRGRLAELGVPTDVYYPKAIPREEVLREFVAGGDSWPVADKAAQEVLALPIFPELTQQEIDLVIQGLHKSL